MKKVVIATTGVALAAGLAFWFFGETVQEVEPEEVPVAKAQPRVSAEKIPMPAPIAHMLETNAESDNKKKRKAWYKERHRTAPGIDWKQVERANGLKQIEKRNLLADSDIVPFAGGDLPTPEWAERGSSNQAGRMHVALHSSDGHHLYAGSAKGGLWKGNTDGTGWEPLGDNLYGGAHNMVVISTGGTDPFDAVVATTDWGSIHRTVDDGDTWTVPAGLGQTGTVRRLIMSSDGTQTVYMVVRRDGNFSLMRSTDAGASFSEIYHMGSYGGDVWTPRDGGADLYMVTDGQVLLSQDHGDNWTAQGSIGSPSEEAHIVGSEAGAPRLWVVRKNDSARYLHRSDDAGATWSFITDVTDYWGSLNASMIDVDVFAWGGVEVFRTDDGGANFELVNPWGDYYADPVNKLHADVPGIDVVPAPGGQEIWYISTDGGLYRSTDSLATVENLSLHGLRVSQYYSTLTSSVEPWDIAAGAQDQGYQISTNQDLPDGLVEFEQILSGDYGHLTSGDGTHDYVFSVYPGFVLVELGFTDPPTLRQVDFPPSENYSWMPPIVADPDSPDEFFFCASRLYRYKISGSNWVPEVWSNLDVSAGDPDEYISALAFSPVDSQRAYMATNRGRLFKSDDHGKNWTQSQTTGPDPHYFYGTAIHASIIDKDTVYVGGSGYGDQNAVYRSTDGGNTFTPWDEGLPDTLVYCLEEAPDGSGILFAGTETAAYRRDADSDQWVDITGADAPVTIYWSVEALASENTIRFGTYGRGIWDYRLDPEHVGCYPVQDYDGDGVDCEGDCDDYDDTIYPGAPEACDGVDVNCDEDDPVEEDGDGDGFLACAECDDGNEEIHPNAQEICGNGIDEDCDGFDMDCETGLDVAAKGGGCACSETPGAGGSPGAVIVLALALVGILLRRRVRS